MNKVNGWWLPSILLFFSFFATSVVRSQATDDQPDVHVLLSEGVYHFNRGVLPDRDELDLAVESFDAVLAIDPDNKAALLLRALTYGEISLLDRQSKGEAMANQQPYGLALDAKENPESLDEYRATLERLDVELGDSTLDAATRLRKERAKSHIERQLRRIDRSSGLSSEELEAKLIELQGEEHQFATAERDGYRKMRADIDRLLVVVTDPESMVRLIGAVTRIQIARLNNDEVYRFEKGELEKGRLSAPVAELHGSADTILASAADLLEGLLAESSDALDVPRIKFFLGVVRYRQGLAPTIISKRNRPNLDRLKQAELLMEELATDESLSVVVKWKSYAALYLGLIKPHTALDAPDEAARSEILDTAESWLRKACEYDFNEGDSGSGGRPYSASNVIPDLAEEHFKEIRRLRDAKPGSTALRNDISLTLFTGALRDTNVVLLGERADLTRGISRTKDYGFSAGLILDYTRDITDRLTLGLVGRTSQLWHADVTEFDEQVYGGSAALQYLLVPESGSFGPVHLRLQYDFDSVLLGRDHFLTTHAVSPNLRFFWANRRAETNFSFTYEIRNYSEPLFDRRLNRDGTYLGLSLSQSYKLFDMVPFYRDHKIEPWGHKNDTAFEQDDPDYPSRYFTPFMALQYTWDQTRGDEFDQKAYTLIIGWILPLPLGVDLDTQAEFEWEEYARGSLIDFHRRPRRDFVQRYEVALSRTWILKAGEANNRYTPHFDRLLMTVRAHATFTHDDSNVTDRLGANIFEYDRTVFGLSLAFSFN